MVQGILSLCGCMSHLEKLRMIPTLLYEFIRNNLWIHFIKHFCPTVHSFVCLICKPQLFSYFVKIWYTNLLWQKGESYWKRIRWDHFCGHFSNNICCWKSRYMKATAPRINNISLRKIDVKNEGRVPMFGLAFIWQDGLIFNILQSQ